MYHRSPMPATVQYPSGGLVWRDTIKILINNKPAAKKKEHTSLESVLLSAGDCTRWELSRGKLDCCLGNEDCDRGNVDVDRGRTELAGELTTVGGPSGPWGGKNTL